MIILVYNETILDSVLFSDQNKLVYLPDIDAGLCDHICGRCYLLENLQFREGRLCCGKYQVWIYYFLLNKYNVTLSEAFFSWKLLNTKPELMNLIFLTNRCHKNIIKYLHPSCLTTIFWCFCEFFSIFDILVKYWNFYWNYRNFESYLP